MTIDDEGMMRNKPLHGETEGEEKRSSETNMGGWQKERYCCCVPDYNQIIMNKLKKSMSTGEILWLCDHVMT